MEPLRVRGPVWSLGLLLALAVGALLTGAVGQDPVLLMLGAFAAVLGVVQLRGSYLVVTEREVLVKSAVQLTRNRVPIAGPGDLRITDRELFRASDSRYIASLSSFAARTEDVERLLALIAAADDGPSGTEPE